MAIDHDFNGIAYRSCHDPSLTCWALYESAKLTRLGEPEAISITDSDLRTIASLWSLKVPVE